MLRTLNEIRTFFSENPNAEFWRSAPPPLADARHPAKKFSSHFLICARPIFSSKPPHQILVWWVKEKENFFAGFCSWRAGRRERSLSRNCGTSARARRNFYPIANLFCFGAPTPPFRLALAWAGLFSAELESVFCKAKYAARNDVALAPTLPCAGNDKELPFVFTNFNKFDNIVIN